MKVFADGRWHVATKHSGIMIQLTDEDKWAISHMSPKDTCYAVFNRYDPRSDIAKREWMQAMKRLINRKDDAV